VWFELKCKEDDSDESTESEVEVEQLTQVVRSLEQVRKPIERYSLPDFHSAFVLTTTDDEHKLVGEVVDLVEGKQWKDVMVKEMESLYKNEMWYLVKLPSGRNGFGSKWVFKKKMNVAGQVEKFKALLVAKGYSQVEGVDFGEIFSLVAKLTSIGVLMSLVAMFDLEIEQMDLKTMFLHRHLEEEIYMKQPKGFVVKGKKELVCKPKISLWSKAITKDVVPKVRHIHPYFGFVISKVDHYIYSKEEGGCFIYVAFYVDDMLLIGNNMNAIKEVKKFPSSKFNMKDISETNFIMGMDIQRD
jgi:hypothetical protein